MSNTSMTSLQRVLTTLGHQEPDRVPQFLTTSLIGARQVGLTIEEYFSQPEAIVEGQLRAQKKFRNDCYIGFLHAPLEIEAFGGEVIYVENGPPNSGSPFITNPDQILTLTAPDPLASPPLRRALDVITGLKEKGNPEIPILGVAISPYSLPVMQMGFPAYLDLMIERPELHQKLVAFNCEFCVAWANAQFDAGITALTYFDPLASPTNIRPEDYRQIGKPAGQKVLSQLKGPAAIHLASGRVLDVVDDLVEIGAAVVGSGDLEDAAEIKAACRGRTTFLGNLNGIEMANWDSAQAENKVKDLLASAATGGGFILCDGHGEIPWQVSDDTLLAISEAVHQWGRYPLTWAAGHGS